MSKTEIRPGPIVTGQGPIVSNCKDGRFGKTVFRKTGCPILEVFQARVDGV